MTGEHAGQKLRPLRQPQRRESEATLLRFDLTALDSSVTVHSAVLELWLEIPLRLAVKPTSSSSTWIGLRGALMASFQPVSLDVPSKLELPTDIVFKWLDDHLFHFRRPSSHTLVVGPTPVFWLPSATVDGASWKLARAN